MSKKVKIKVDFLEKGKIQTKTVSITKEAYDKHRNDLKGYLRGFLLGKRPEAWEILDK